MTAQMKKFLQFHPKMRVVGGDFPIFEKINGLDELVAVMSWRPQARRKCISSWVSGLQSLRYIRSNLKKISKNQVGGGGYIWVKIAPSPHLDVRKRQECRSVRVKCSKIVDIREAFCNNVLSQGHETCNERQIMLLFSKLSLGGVIW